jgi:hypothetical protein
VEAEASLMGLSGLLRGDVADAAPEGAGPERI